MEKKKILQFTVAASKGGSTQYVLNNWKNIDRERFHFDFVTFSPYLDFAEELEEQGCKIYYMPCYPQQDRNRFIDSFGKVLQNGYDTLHLHTSYWRGTEAEEIAKQYRIKQVIVHAHSTGFGKARTKEEEIEGTKKHLAIREKLNEKMATDFLACSHAAAEWIFGDCIPKNRIMILHNAIDTKRFAYSEDTRKKVRCELEIQDKFVLGHVGRLALPKNHDFLLDVFCEVQKKIPNAVLILVGEGELREKIEGKIKDLRLESKVKLLGKRNDVNRLLQGMDLFVFPSLFEGFPIGLIEAQTTGLNCIVSDQITSEVVITPLVKQYPLIASEWVNSIQTHYRDHTFRRKNMQFVIDDAGYGIKKQIRELEKIYGRDI